MLLILTACSTTPVVTEAPNDFTLTTRDVYYDIAGPRASDIAQQLDDHSRNNGGRLAETRWKLKSKLRFGPRDSGCIMETADIAVDIETELPRWQGAIRAPDALRAQWQKFEAAARTHERGHYDHGISAAHEVTAALKGLTAASCDALGKAATAKTQAVVSKYEAIDTQYDADTRHGILQGTVWNYE